MKRPFYVILAILLIVVFLTANYLTKFMKPVIVFDGNSLVYGNNVGQEQNLPAQVGQLYGEKAIVYNFGVGAQTTQSMQKDAAQQIDPILRPYRTNILVAWEGTNELYFGASPDTAYQDLVSYSRERKEKGWKVILLTLLPRSNRGTRQGFEQDRLLLNQRLVRDFSTKTACKNILLPSTADPYADALVDVGSIDEIGDAGDELTSLYLDRVHLSAEGYFIVASYTKPAIDLVLKKKVDTCP
jgi:lysophospholipase L1-like esterase